MLKKYCPLRDGQCVGDECMFFIEFNPLATDSIEGECAVKEVAVHLHNIREDMGGEDR